MNNDMNYTETVESAPKKNRRVLKSGSYTLAVTAIVIAIIVVVNVLLAALPETKTKLDMSEESLYSVGDTTKDIVGKITDPVTLYIICEEGKEDMTMTKMVESYGELFENITVKTVDPAVNPNFTAEYTTESLSNNSLIAVSDKRSTFVKYNDCLRFSIEGYGELTYSEMSQFMNQYYMQYGSAPDYKEIFYGEQNITSAISYVTSDSIPALYYTTGHGEAALDNTYKSYVSAENYSYAELNLLTNDIPDDAEAIFLYAPTNDFTPAEAEKILHYVKKGGDVVFVSDFTTYKTESMPNLAGLLASFGMKSVDGLVMEGDQNHYFQYNNYILPVIGASDDSSPVSRLESKNIYMLAVGAHAIETVEADNVTVTTILSTTDKAYLKPEINDETTYQKQDGDIEGQFVLGAAATYLEGGHFVWYSTTAVADSAADSMIGKGNSQMFIATLNWMAGKTESISIIGKNISVDPLTVTESSAGLWRAILCVIVPVVTLGAGITVWVRRRRR